MSLNEKKQEDIFAASNMLKRFLNENDPMAIFSREIFPIFNDKDFADCYSTKGRNAIPPSFLSAVTILQFMENMSDPESAEACINRIDWKIALHIPLERNISFHPSSLCNFRRRLKENEKLSFIFDKILNLVKEKGFIKENSKQRIDATHIIKHVNRITTTDLLYRTVKCVVEEIEKQDCEYYQREIPEYIKERYWGKFSSFGLSMEKRGDKQTEIVEDGLYLAKLLEKNPCENYQKMEQLEIMNTVFDENVKIVQKEIDEKVFIKVEEIQTPKQTIFDPRDTSIKLGKKGKKTWVGNKCHVVETANKGETNFITNMIHQRSNNDDSKIHDAVKDGNDKRELKPEKVYVDSAYISGKQMKEYEENGSELKGYMQNATQNKEEGFNLENFDIDMNNNEATCPNGKKSEKSTIQADGAIYIYFKKEDCQSCCFFEKCVGTKSRSVKRYLHVNPYYDYIRKRRADQKETAFKKELSVRAQIEATISEAVRFHGLRKLKFKKELGHKLQFLLVGAGINLKRLLKVLAYGIHIPQKT